jgi:quinol monooxygenase YgiN
MKIERRRVHRKSFFLTTANYCTSRVALLTLTILVLVTVRSFPKSTGEAFSPHNNNNIMSTFSLLVTLQFTEQQYKDQFLEFFRPVAQHVQQHEPDTLAYEVLLSDKDPLQVLILERYRDKDNAYLTVHRSSQPFLEFRPKLNGTFLSGCRSWIWGSCGSFFLIASISTPPSLPSCIPVVCSQPTTCCYFHFRMYF